MTSWTRSRAPSLVSSRARWALAVVVLIDGRSAISGLVMPPYLRAKPGAKGLGDGNIDVLRQDP